MISRYMLNNVATIVLTQKSCAQKIVLAVAYVAHSVFRNALRPEIPVGGSDSLYLLIRFVSSLLLLIPQNPSRHLV